MVRFEKEKTDINPFDLNAFREELSELGDSLLVVADDEIVKVHIHAEYPGEVFNRGQRFGSFLKIKVENMREQHSNLVHDDKEKKQLTPIKNNEKQEYGIVTVAMGSGIKELFESIGATVVIEGGQTMNPSTEDIVKAIEKCNAKNVIVLPNNGNIVMAAEQAATVSEADVVVVPSKSVPQGMSALLAFNPTVTLEENAEGMKDALQNVKTGQVTFAVRDTEIDGVEIKKDHFMGILENKIITTDENQLGAAKKLLSEMVDEDSEILTILQGQDVSDEELAELVSYVEDQFEEIEVEVHKGNQPLYSYIFSIE
jgi:DAK2 domain fusion protein YloV